MNKAKGERMKPISMLLSDFILASAISEVNNIPLFRHQRYVYLTPAMLVKPMLELTLATFDEEVMTKYYDSLQPYLEMIADLRFDCFVQYVKEKRAVTHSLTGQGIETPQVGDFVLVKDLKKHQWLKYGVILALSTNKTKALVRTTAHRKGEWLIIPMLYPLVSGEG